MDILNFIHWIRNRRIVKSAPKGSLLAIGIKDPRRDDRYLTCAIRAEDLGLGEGGSTTGLYRTAEFADTIIPKTDFNESTIGKVIDAEGADKASFFYSSFHETLENGEIANVAYNQSILESGILIYEAYTSEEDINGYWIAYKQDSNNPERLIKIGELKMTAQFWDNWYNYTAKDSGPNVVKFVTTPSWNNSEIISYTTKLTWTGSQLVAEDIVYNWGSFESLYTELTGYVLSAPSFDYKNAEYILDDDYYGMAMGKDKGWCYIRATKGFDELIIVPAQEWLFIAVNVLTGETKTYYPITELASLTNWSSLDIFNSIEDWIAHPDGITFALADGNICDNGDNYNGVTAIWSPYWNDPTTVIYLGMRYQNCGTEPCGNRMLINGQFVPESSTAAYSWYWDNKAFYLFSIAYVNGTDMVRIVHKYHVDTKETTSYIIPFVTIHNSNNYNTISYPSLWANNNGLIYYEGNMGTLSWGTHVYHMLKHEDSKVYTMHLDTTYPTHAFGKKIYNINTWASYNFDRLGVALSTYKKINF